MNRLHRTPWDLAGQPTPLAGLNFCMAAVAAVEQEAQEQRGKS